MRFILNCDRSAGARMDWTYADAVEAGVVADAAARAEVDLRADDWPVRDQGATGACVGFAAADGVLHWHYRQAGLLGEGERPSPRFIWMANKETDRLTSFPTTFIESAGTQIKLALRVARKYGCVTESTLPMDGTLSSLSTEAFYAGAAKYRIASYHNLGRDPERWRAWISNQGPVLVRVVVDRTWERAAAAGGELDRYREDPSRGGHAACLVGYTGTHLIVRNSWGQRWGDRGFAYASDAYAASAFDEAYGAVLGERDGTGPDDDPLLGAQRRRSRAEGRTEGRASLARALLAARGIEVSPGFSGVPGFAELPDHVIAEAATACVSEADFLKRLRSR